MRIENAQIMMVDDEPDNLDLLANMLECDGYTVLAFRNAQIMDGYEVCRELKKVPGTSQVPVLFMSALTETEDKLRGFEVGGGDYITKPLQEREVLARVKTHLELQMHRHKLQDLLSQRSAQLFDAHSRLKILDKVKNDWLNVLAHELRTPLTGIFGVADLVFSELPQDSDVMDMRSAYEQSRERIEKLIKDAALLIELDTEDEADLSNECHFSDVLLNVVNTHDCKQKKATIELLRTDDSLWVKGRIHLLERCLRGLLETACMCVADDETVRVSLCKNGDIAVVNFVTDGKCLSPEALDMFFEVGGQIELLKGGGDFGLRPALSKAILKIMRGKAKVENRDEGGIAISAALPLSATRE